MAQHSTEPKEPQEGKDYHIKGFILNKLCIGGYFCKTGRKHHGKHMSTDDLPKGYPIEHRGKFPKIIKELKRSGLITIFPAKYGEQVCVSSNPQKLDECLHLINLYRKAVELPPLDRRFREVIS